MDTSDLFTRAFWTATVQRVVRSFAASLASLLVADGSGILNTAWADRLSVAGMAGVVTLLLCVAGGTTSGNGPAFGTAEVTETPPYPAGNERGAMSTGEGIAVAGVVVAIVVLIVILLGGR